MQPRQKFYVDPEVQFPVILGVILLVVGQGPVVGWAFSKLIALAREWERPDQATQFFKVALLTVVPIVAVNFLIGAWLSHKIAGPLWRIRQAMGEIARGNLEVELSIRGRDILQGYAQEMNRMVQTLRRLIYRDHQHAAEADALLTKCRQWAARRKDVPEGARKELEELIDGAKSRLSIINAHFLKGKDVNDGLDGGKA